MGERDRGSAMADWLLDDGPRGWGIAPLPSDAARQLVVVAGARRMGAFNGGQRSGLRRRGACVETRAGNATEEESRSLTGRPVRETRGPPSYAAGRSADMSSLVNMPT